MRYQTIEFGDDDIHLRCLRDNQQFDDEDQVAENLGVPPSSWPLFGLLWESGEILSRLMHKQNITGLRVLEVGCGLGLASLVLSQRGADITATDYNPEAANFLLQNVALNKLQPIPFVRTGWELPSNELGTFHLIIGSDLLYEKSNVGLLSDFIGRHLTPEGEVLLVDPGRGLQAQFTRRMVELGYRHNSSARVAADISSTYRGRVLSYSNTEA